MTVRPYDIIFKEGKCVKPAPNECTYADLAAGDLPLMLAESGSKGMSVGYTSPYGGRLSKGDLQNADLTTDTVRTQRDWSGGNLLKRAYGETNKFYLGLADTRYPGQITLPPKVYGPFPIPHTGDVKVRPMRETISNRLYVVINARLYYVNMSDNLAPNNSGVWTLRFNGFFTGETDLVDFGGNFYLAANGNLYKSTDRGTIWNQVAGVAAKYLSVNAGFLDVVASDTSYRYSADGTTFSANIVVGLNKGTMTGITRLGTEPIAIKSVGMWSIKADIPYQIFSWSEYASLSNGVGALPWGADGRLYVPVREGLWAWNGSASLMEQVGLDLNEGIPAGEATTVRMLSSSGDTLFVLCGEEGKQNAIYARTLLGGWHCLYKPANGVQIYAMCCESGPGTWGPEAIQPRLIWFEGPNMYYMHVGEPKQNYSRTVKLNEITSYISTRQYGPSAEVIQSFWGAEYSAVRKALHRVVLQHDNVLDQLAADADKSVAIEVDESGIWIPLSETKMGTLRSEYDICESGFIGSKVTGSQGRNLISLESTSGLTAGQFVRVGTEVFQITLVFSATDILVLPYFVPSSIAIGAACVRASPVGYQFRVKVTLTRGTDESYTPKIRGVGVQYRDVMIGPRRFGLTVRVEDGLKNKQDGAYPLSAAQLRQRLTEWIKRGTSFWMVGLDGEPVQVVVSNVNESQFSATNAGHNSQMQITLIEVT